MADTFYRIANDMIVTCNEDMSVPLGGGLRLAMAGTEDDQRAECEAMLHRANTQPGLLKACKAFIDHRHAVGVAQIRDDLDSIPSERIGEIIDQISAAIAATTPEKAE